LTHELEIFWSLQGIDGELRAVRERLARLPARRAEIERGTNEAKAALAAGEERVKSAALAKRKAEQDAEALGEQEKKFQLQLSQVKKNDEYAALLHEIEAAKQKRSALETFVLERMEDEGQVAAQVARDKAAFAAAQAKAGEESRVVDAEEKQLKGEEGALEARRDGLLGELPTALRSRYLRIHTAKKGQALAELVAGSCAACGAAMPLQTAIEVRRGQNVLECPNCGRILVYRASVEGAPPA
jgi:predicted  nucleic acid-binding Zn-ribbon protein